MARLKEVNSVAHNILDHAVSGLGFLVSHVLDYCAKSGERELCLDLLRVTRCPGLEAEPPLVLSSSAKHEKFIEILSMAGFDASELASAVLRFRVLGDPRQESARFTCECILKRRADGPLWRR